MTDLSTFFRDEPNLQLSNFTNNFYTMEDKKGVNGSKSLQDLKKEVQQLSHGDSIRILGGKTLEKDKWNSTCGGIVPQ
jgi:hypothetical protein